MKVLIVSDTHGRERNLEKALEKEKPIDQLIHLGDVEGSEDYIRAMTDVPVTIVAGNNDYYSDLPHEEILQLGKYRVLATHGHYYYVNRGHERLWEAAAEKGVDIVMYGHTHVPCLEQKNGVTVLNPGSLTLPRQQGYCPSYIVMETAQDGEAHYKICYLDGDKISWFMKK